MQNLIPEEHKQRKFIKKYEAGLHYFEQGLQNSLSHTFYYYPKYTTPYINTIPTKSLQQQV